MPGLELSEVVMAAGAVSSTAGETAAIVDLSAVSQQLDLILCWHQVHVLCLGLIAGAVIGVAVAKAVGRFWR